MRDVSVTPSRRMNNAPQTQLINIPKTPELIVRNNAEEFKVDEITLYKRSTPLTIKPNDKIPMAFPENPFQSNGGVSPLPELTISNDPMAIIEAKPHVDKFKSTGGVSSLPELTISNDPMQLTYIPPKVDPYPASGGFAPANWQLEKHKPMDMTPDTSPLYDDPAEKVLLEVPPINVIVPKPPEMTFYGTWFSEFIRTPQLSTTFEPMSAKSAVSAKAAESNGTSIPIPPPFRNAERDAVIEQASKANQTPVESEKNWDRYAEDPTPRLFGVRV